MEMEAAVPGTSNHIARTDDLLTHAVGLAKLSAESKRRGKGCLGRSADSGLGRHLIRPLAPRPAAQHCLGV